jgi:hypothetical protein
VEVSGGRRVVSFSSPNTILHLATTISGFLAWISDTTIRLTKTCRESTCSSGLHSFHLSESHLFYGFSLLFTPSVSTSGSGDTNHPA